MEFEFTKASNVIKSQLRMVYLANIRLRLKFEGLPYLLYINF
jgi:hypothetical protein